MTHTNHKYCECREGCHCSGKPGPVAITVKREGTTEPLHICTRCYLTDTDEILSVVIPTDPPPMTHQQYDLLGCIALSMSLVSPIEGEV